MARSIRVTDESPPNVLSFDELEVGDTCEEAWRIEEADWDAFVAISGDRAPVHRDDDHARRLGFPSRIVHGMFTTLRFSRLLGMYLPGTRSVICGLSFDYKRPVFVGDTLNYSVVVEHLSRATGMVRLKLRVLRGNEICVLGVGKCLLKAP